MLRFHRKLRLVRRLIIYLLLHLLVMIIRAIVVVDKNFLDVS